MWTFKLQFVKDLQNIGDIFTKSLERLKIEKVRNE